MMKQAYQQQNSQNSSQKYSAYEQQQQVQILKLTKKQQEEVELIRYYIYENFQFLINLIHSLKAINEHFIDDPQHPMTKIARNKIMLQLNLSNSIHYDQQYQYQSDPKLNQVLKQEKENAKQLLEQLSPELKEEFQKYFDIYQTNSLNQNIQICQQNYEQTNLDAKFEQNVLQLVIDSIQQVDQTTKQFREQKIYNRPSIQEIFEKSQNYYEKTKQCLEINFPNPINKKQEPQFINQCQNAHVPKFETKQKSLNKLNLPIYKPKLQRKANRQNKHNENKQFLNHQQEEQY